MESVSEKRGFTSFILKLIAICAMLVDHIAWAFVPLFSFSGQFMHMMGRITMPIMCFFVAEGYYKTRNVKKYSLRLLIFSLVSYLPFIYFETGSLPNGITCLNWNVGFDLLAGLLALWTWDRMKNPLLRMVLIGLCFLLSFFADWSIFGVGFILLFGIFHGDFKRQAVSFSVWGGAMVLFGMIVLPMMRFFAGGFLIFPYQMVLSQFYQAGIFIALPLLKLYSGRRGGGKYGKWIFYIFYPLHLLLLGMIQYN